MAPAPKSSMWKIAQSWWILLTFTFFFNWIAFIYIAARAGYKRWAVWALGYSVPFMGMMAEFDSESWQSDVAVALLLIGGLFSIFHAFRVRHEFLMRLEARQLAAKSNQVRLRRQIESEFGVRLDGNTAAAGEVTEPKASEAAAALPGDQSAVPAAAELLDLNAASEKDFSALPGIGIVLAKKAVTARGERGGFGSVDDFIQDLQLKPHIAVRIRPLVTVNPVESAPPPSRGRVVDF